MGRLIQKSSLALVTHKQKNNLSLVRDSLNKHNSSLTIGQHVQVFPTSKILHVFPSLQSEYVPRIKTTFNYIRAGHWQIDCLV